MNPPDTPSHTEPATLDEQVATALEVTENLTTIVTDLAARLIAIERALPSPAPGETRSDFRFESYPQADTETEEREQLERVRAAWERLDAWVDWLVATYRLTSVIPPCWAEHTTIVEELIGLRVNWTGAWSDTASHDAITSWHERLARARARFADGNWGRPRCDGTHNPTGLDLAEQYTAWAEHHGRESALIAARDRALRQVTDGHGPGTR